uniref:carboxypeptidase T n=1 Tax=candidate division WOR-3 bacterium TaxID=2052148 RepID=A0A7C4YAI9_UNCW3
MIFILIFSLFNEKDMIIRVYARTIGELSRIQEKPLLDIASAKKGEYFDIVADEEIFRKIRSSGLKYEIIVESLSEQKRLVKGSYHSYDEVNNILRNYAQNYPSICVLESLPIPTYQGNWIYGVKISDEPYFEDPDEPGILIDALHHSREWATIELVLFAIDSILKSYGNVPEITNIVNTREIYLFPIINADGYLYDYPSQYSWRKNREPFGGAIGTDPNRNYPGCSGDIEGDWGAVDEGQATHYPSDDAFCGPYANSGDETRALTLFVKSHEINANMSYHSYQEELYWPWGWTGSPTPDSILYSRFGNRMADLIQKLSGGSYGRGQIYSAIYPVSGSSLEWVYSYNKWVKGIPNLSFVTEVGTAFYQPASDLDNISRQNFKAIKYLCQFADSIIILSKPAVPQPEIIIEDTVPQTFTINWIPKYPEYNTPSKWELVELSNMNITTDDAESGSSRWVLDGFSLSTSQAHSGTHSYFSGNTNDMNSALLSKYPYIVKENDSLIFWCYYNLETNYDVAVVEVSENRLEWFNLDTTRFTGSSGWVRKKYSLNQWAGKSVYFRFRSMTDGSTLNGGFYVDDIYPSCIFGNVDTISSTITDTFFTFEGHSMGEAYFYVRGYNSEMGWGEYSNLKKVYVKDAGIASNPEIIKPFNFARLPDNSPQFGLFSIDPQNDNIQYGILIDDNKSFSSPETIFTGLYSSGDTAFYTIQSSLDFKTYWFRARAKDNGSNLWTGWSDIFTFTISSDIPLNTCSWIQCKGEHFEEDTLSGIFVSGDSLLLYPSGGTITDTILFEDFEDGIPSNWNIVNSNGDGYYWVSGTTSDLGSYTPPNYGTKYAFYSDDDAGNLAPQSVEEGLITPPIYVGMANNLTLKYGYGYRDYSSYDYFRVRLRRFISGSWGSWIQLREYNSSVSGTENIVLSSYLPCDSIQIEWYYTETSPTWGWACAVDNITLTYEYILQNDSGYVIGKSVSFDEISNTYPRNNWGDVVISKSHPDDSILISVEYKNNGNWELIPDLYIPQNSTGIYHNSIYDTISLSNVNPETYRELRLKGRFYRNAKKSEPSLLSWEIGNLSRYVGIVDKELEIKVYPNVFVDFLNIEGKGIKSVKIYDIIGRKVKEIKFSKDLRKMRWSGEDNNNKILPKGIYFIRIETEKNLYNKKVIFIR